MHAYDMSDCEFMCDQLINFIHSPQPYHTKHKQRSRCKQSIMLLPHVPVMLAMSNYAFAEVMPMLPVHGQ